MWRNVLNLSKILPVTCIYGGETDINHHSSISQSGPAGDWGIVVTLWVDINYYWRPCYILPQLSCFIPDSERNHLRGNCFLTEGQTKREKHISKLTKLWRCSRVCLNWLQVVVAMTTPPHSQLTFWHEGTEEVCLELRCRKGDIVEKGPLTLSRSLTFLYICVLDKLESYENPSGTRKQNTAMK